MTRLYDSNVRHWKVKVLNLGAGIKIIIKINLD